MAGRLRLKDFEDGKPLSDTVYEQTLKQLQRQLQIIQTAYIVQKRRAIVLFEGWDAAGKGGTIKRLTEPLDPRFCRVWPIAAPDEHELARHYLYRFWRRLPGRGELAVFDRSWYGRVLVERVEGLCPPEAWGRAYGEINEFERMLTQDGTRLVKLFLHVTPAVQAERLRERLEVPYKRWKTGFDDFRNRDRRADYHAAIEDMFDRTSTRHAPWTVIAANHKKAARIRCIETIIATLSRDVDLTDPVLDPALKRLAEKSLGVRLKAD
ncbi:polyphosphate kinase 2 family protein [Parapedomonas caeni]|jgi:polyphosphate kinase 2 (PPK2 family)